MAKIQDVEIPSLLFDEQASAPTTPATGFWRAYFKSDGMYVVDDVGTETGPFGAGGGGITQAYAGYNTAGGSWETMTTYRVYAKKITLANDSLLTSIEAYIRNDSAGADDQVESLSAAVYTDSSGTPAMVVAYCMNDGATLLMDSAAGSSGDGTARWVGVPIGKWLSAGDYWIAVMGSDTITIQQIAYDGSGTDRYHTATGTWFADWGHHAPTTSSNKYSIRANTIR